MNEELILVNERDEKVGTEDKLKAHQKGNLHRAFSIFVFGKQGQILLQRRATSKYHSGGQWTSACDGHPRPAESVVQAAHRRLKAEMGFDCDLTEVFSYIYEASMGNGLTEHEFNHILVGSFNGEPSPDLEEVQDYKWEDTTNLLKDLRAQPENYAVWFRIAMEKFPPENLGAKQPERLYHVKNDDSIVGPVARDQAHSGVFYTVREWCSFKDLTGRFFLRGEARPKILSRTHMTAHALFMSRSVRVTRKPQSESYLRRQGYMQRPNTWTSSPFMFPLNMKW